jgi:hypothetical protein
MTTGGPGTVHTGGDPIPSVANSANPSLTSVRRAADLLSCGTTLRGMPQLAKPQGRCRPRPSRETSQPLGTIPHARCLGLHRQPPPLRRGPARRVAYPIPYLRDVAGPPILPAGVLGSDDLRPPRPPLCALHPPEPLGSGPPWCNVDMRAVAGPPAIRGGRAGHQRVRPLPAPLLGRREPPLYLASHHARQGGRQPGLEPSVLRSRMGEFQKRLRRQLALPRGGAQRALRGLQASRPLAMGLPPMALAGPWRPLHGLVGPLPAGPHRCQGVGGAGPTPVGEPRWGSPSAQTGAREDPPRAPPGGRRRQRSGAQRP